MGFERPTIVEVLVIALVVSMLAWLANDTYRHETAERRGARDAEADLRRGVVAYHLRGKGMPWIGNFIRLASERFGIQVIRTGGCVCSGPDCTYDYAYNRVVEEHLARQLGFNPIQRLFDEAWDGWNVQFEEAHAVT